MALYEQLTARFKEAIGIAKDLLLLLLVGTLFVFPGWLNDRLSAAGITKFGALGIEIEKLNKSAASASASTGDAYQRIELVKKKVDGLSKLVGDIEKAYPPQRNGVSIKDVQDSLIAITQLLKSTNQQLSTAQNAQAAIQTTTHKVETQLEVPQQDATPWGLVISGDQTLKEAQYELNRARKLGYPQVATYARKGWIRSVIRFSNQEQALAARPQFKGAYVVALNTWCPAPVTGNGELDFTCE